MRKTFFLDIPYLELAIAAGSFAVGTAAFVHQMLASAPSVAQTQEAPKGVNVGGNNTGNITINNYPEALASEAIKSVDQQENTYAEGTLTVKPLECIKSKSSMQCSLSVTSVKSKSLIRIDQATLASNNGRPYMSEEVGFGGKNSGGIAIGYLSAGVPTLIYTKFMGVPDNAQQGTLHMPIQFGGNEEVIRLDVVSR